MDNIYQNQPNNVNSIHKCKNDSEKENTQKRKIIEKISELFTEICDENKSELNPNNTNTLIKPFISKQIPSISIKDYLTRLYKYSKINNSTIVLILIYIDKICNFNNFKISYFNIHKLILASMLIAIKYNEDENYSLSFYSKLGGVSKNELSNLEYQFLVLIHCEAYIKEELFIKYNEYLTSSDSDEEEGEEEEKEEEEDESV